MKTVRGSYFYICVGDNFYAGTRPIMTTVLVDKPRELTAKEKEIPKYRRIISSRWGHYREPVRNGKHDKWRYGLIESVKEPTKQVEVIVPSNQYIDEWTTEFEKAKKFRNEQKALAKAEELAKNNCMDKIKPKVVFYKGDR